MAPQSLPGSPLSPALQQLLQIGGEAFVARVVDTFLDSAPPYVDAALRALADGDAAAAASACHALRSGAMQVGAETLAAACLTVERGAKGGDAPRALAAPVRAVAAELGVAMARLRDQLRARATPSAGEGTVPDGAPAGTRVAADDHVDPSVPPTRVLVVEDDPATRAVLLATLTAVDERSRLLPVLGARSVGTLEAARALIRAGEVDVVLLDLGLPDSDGLATFHGVREIAALPVVILTSLDDQQLALQAVRSGAQDYLLKHDLDGALLRRTVLYAADRFRLHQVATRQLAAQKDEAVARLAAGTAHDVNNLLAIVCGAVEGASRELPPQHAAQGELAAADHALRTIATLMRELLAVGRRRASRAQPIDVATFVHGLLAGLRRSVGAVAVLDVDCDPDVGSVLADATHLEQVLLNLVVNARDAVADLRAGGTGRITLRARRAADAGGDQVDISVEDNGAGIQPEVQTRMFEPFFTTRATQGGTGLGLATVQGIVAQAGGVVHVESAPGRGTRLTIRLPRADGARRAGAVARLPERAFGERAAAPATSPAGPSVAPEHAGPAVAAPAVPTVGRSGVVLLVEDDAAVRRMVHGMLRRAGFTVHEAPDGSEGLQTWRRLRHEITTVLSDMRMPGGVSGGELASRIRAEGGTARIVLMSGCLEEEVTDVGRGFAVDAFLEKPFRADALIAAVRPAGAVAAA